MKRWPWFLFVLGLVLTYLVGPSMHSEARAGLDAAQLVAGQSGDDGARAARMAGGILDGMNFTLYGLVAQSLGLLLAVTGLLVGIVDLVRHVRRSRRSVHG